MQDVTLAQLHKEMLGIKKEIARIRLILDEEYEPSDHVVAGVKESRARPEGELVSNEEMRAEFGS